MPKRMMRITTCCDISIFSTSTNRNKLSLSCTVVSQLLRGSNKTCADFNENTEVTQDKTKDNFVEPDRPLTEEGYYGTSPEPRLVHPNKVFKLRKKGGTKIPSFESSTKIKRGNLYFLVNSGH